MSLRIPEQSRIWVACTAIPGVGNFIFSSVRSNLTARRLENQWSRGIYHGRGNLQALQIETKRHWLLIKLENEYRMANIAGNLISVACMVAGVALGIFALTDAVLFWGGYNLLSAASEYFELPWDWDAIEEGIRA